MTNRILWAILIGLTGCSSGGSGNDDAGPVADLRRDLAHDVKPDVVAEGSVGLVRQGVSKHHLVLNVGASSSEKQAARELQQHIKAVSGATLPIRQGAPDGGVPMIVLGAGEVAKKHGVVPSDNALGQEDFLLRTSPPHLFIAGTPGGGTLHGGHRFLERYLGARWLSPKVTLTPPSRTSGSRRWTRSRGQPSLCARPPMPGPARTPRSSPAWASTPADAPRTTQHQACSGPPAGRGRQRGRFSP